MKNGRADHDDDPERDPKIARIEDARRRKQLGLSEPGGGGGSSGGGGRRASRAPAMTGSIKEMLVGAVIVAMAIGMLVWWTRPLWQGLVAAP